MELKIKSIPSSDDINAFADKYVLITEGRKNKGLIFPPLVRKLFALQGEKQSKYISRIVDIQKQYSKLYGAAEYTPLVFPEAIMLGSICYPREIFSQNLISECTKQGLISNHSVELPFTCELDSQFHVLLTENNENAKAMTVLSHVMLAFVVGNIPLLYCINKEWYNALMNTVFGKLVLGITGIVILVTWLRMNKQTKPIEYKE